MRASRTSPTNEVGVIRKDEDAMLCIIGWDTCVLTVIES